MESTTILVVLGGTWAAMSNVMKTIELKNRIRDRVLGMHGSECLTRDQKQLLLERDYIPLSHGVALFLAIFTIGILAFPYAIFMKNTSDVVWPEWIVAIMAASFSGFAMVTDICASKAEREEMRKSIAESTT